MSLTLRNKPIMPAPQTLQKLKRWFAQWLEHESLFWILPLTFFLLLALELVVMLNRLY